VNVVAEPGGNTRGQLPTVTDVGRMPAVTLPRKILASLTTIAAGAGLMVFATVGAFDSTSDPFPRSFLAPVD
jgi:hypothetical protein